MPQKPMLSVQDLIVHSKEKGIQFNSISEAEAQDYLARNNNYFKLASYRKNYPKFTDGPKQGQYENLDFAYLIELARIDVEVRHILLKMCLDIEHFLKVRQIRNAAAHNSCIINDLNTTQKSSAPPFITQFAARAGIGETMRRKKLSNQRINQITHLLYVYDQVVTSENTRAMRLSELQALLDQRMLQHQEYFQSNSLLTSTHQYFQKLAHSLAASC